MPGRIRPAPTRIAHVTCTAGSPTRRTGNAGRLGLGRWPVVRGAWAMAGRSASGSWFGYFGVVHADVEVQLLRVGRVGPARPDPFGHGAECQLPPAKVAAYVQPRTEKYLPPHP